MQRRCFMLDISNLNSFSKHTHTYIEWTGIVISLAKSGHFMGNKGILMRSCNLKGLLSLNRDQSGHQSTLYTCTDNESH